jgi:hypothetical protein
MDSGLPRRSAELVLVWLIEIPGVLHPADQRHGIEVVGLHEIIEGFAMIAQLGIEQAHKEVGVHLKAVGEIHARKMANPGAPGKS